LPQAPPFFREFVAKYALVRSPGLRIASDDAGLALVFWRLEIAMFDPYRKWLSIPVGERPPDAFHLLGVDPGETDPEVIEEAVIRQTAHVRTYQTGPHAAECAQLLTEIAEAGALLLDPVKRDQQASRRAPRPVPAPSQMRDGRIGILPHPRCRTIGVLPQARAILPKRMRAAYLDWLLMLLYAAIVLVAGAASFWAGSR
jgi:hypothetical protein